VLAMFVLTQLIGIYVVNYYSPTKVVDGVITNTSAPKLPFGFEPGQVEQDIDFWRAVFPSLIFAFVISVSIFFILRKFRAENFLRTWFFVVILMTLTISLLAILPAWKYALILAFAISLLLAFFKVYQRRILIHNITELLVYPGIAAVFVAFISSPTSLDRGVFAIIALLALISAYDIWAVWHSGIMQKMAKYQMDKVKVFSGFFIPYMSKQAKLQLMHLKKSTKNKKLKEQECKKIKVNVAILGGGDVVFPIIASGVILRKFGFTTISWLGGIQLPIASLLVVLGATLGLGFLLFFSEKKKFYPAMPYISTGILFAIGLSYLLGL